VAFLLGTRIRKILLSSFPNVGGDDTLPVEGSASDDLNSNKGRGTAGHYRTLQQVLPPHEPYRLKLLSSRIWHGTVTVGGFSQSAGAFTVASVPAPTQYRSSRAMLCCESTVTEHRRKVGHAPFLVGDGGGSAAPGDPVGGAFSPRRKADPEWRTIARSHGQ